MIFFFVGTIYDLKPKSFKGAGMIECLLETSI